ncbi:MAG: type II secretion system F family protein [Nitrospirae bacterium]|nr:type II secretion system F family protein [Nitrospirota bacterium]MBF0540284.1 type II secretion system F family protein [Nitrospirota bacterium]
MSLFIYKAIDTNGGVVKGIIDAADLGSFDDIMSASNMYVLSVKEGSGKFVELRKKMSGRSIKSMDMIEFASNVSIMLKAGVPILDTLVNITETTENKYFAERINSVAKRIELGAKFSDSLEFERDVFPDIFMRLVRVGEETGSLSETLESIAEHLQRLSDLAGVIKRSLMYPVFAILATIGALFFWLIFVMPHLMDVFKDFNLKLPLLTRILLAASRFAQHYWYIVIITPIIILIIYLILKRYDSTLYMIDSMKLKLPVFKLILNHKLLALFCEQMRTLIIAGITIDRAFQLIEEDIGNEVFKRALIDIRERVIAGEKIAQSIREHKVFPLQMVRMISVGEESGSLDKQFGLLSEIYLKKLDDISKTLGKIIEPLVIGFVGILFMIMVGGLLLPVFDIVTGIGGM